MAKGRSSSTHDRAEREREDELGGEGPTVTDEDERAAQRDESRSRPSVPSTRDLGKRPIEGPVPAGQPLAPPARPQQVDEHEGEPLELPPRRQPEPATEPLVPG